jgi:hypothetical protein
MEIIQDDIKQEFCRKECLVCGKTRAYYSSRLKESSAFITLILWREYDGMIGCAECFASIREA